MRNLELIGEAATRIPDTVRGAMRNRLILGYLEIDDDTLWSVIKTDIPALLPQLQALREQAR